MSTSNPQSPSRVATIAKKQKRRANSCLPCRETKSRCTGGIPCAGCLKKRQKPRCIYPHLPPKVTEAYELRANTLPRQDKSNLPTSPPQQGHRHDDDDDTLVIPLGDFFGSFSLLRAVDEYRQSSSLRGSIRSTADSVLTTRALLAKSTDGQSLTSSQPTVDQATGVTEATKPLLSIDLDSQLPKHIRWLYSKYLSVCQMLDTGKLTQAWTTFPKLMREVELYGMDQARSDEAGTSNYETTEAKRLLWWHLIDLDLRLSLLVNRKPHLHAGAFEFPQPSFDYLKPAEKLLQQRKLEFKLLMMEVLTSINADKAQATQVTEGRRPEQESVLRKFERLQEKVLALSQDSSKDIGHSIAVAEHQLDVHLFSIMFYSHLARFTKSDQFELPGPEKSSAGQSKPVKSRTLRKKSSDKTQEVIFQSARTVMELFDFLFISDSTRTALSWTQCFGAYSAAVLLGEARLRQDVDPPTDSLRIQQTLKVFQELSATVPALNIARLASASLESLAVALGGLVRGRNAPVKTEPMQMKRSPTISREPDASLGSTQTKGKSKVDPVATSIQRQGKRSNPSVHDDTQHREKRPKFSTNVPSYDGRRQSVPDWSSSQEHQYVQQGSSISDIPMEPFHDQSASTSFTGNEPMEYGSYGSNQDNSHHFPVEPWYHPPMFIHPPMYDRHWWGQGAPPIMLGDDGIQHGFYCDSSPMTMNAQHHLDPQLHDQQSMILNTMAHVNAPHVVDGSLKDNTTIAGPTHTSIGPDQVQPQHDPTFYNAVEEAQYPAGQHSISSPVLGKAPTSREGAFAHPADSTRRHSVADIRQPRAWTVETPANYKDGKKQQGKVKASIEQPRTSPRDGILSPLSEAGLRSRRNSTTPRQIAEQGMNLDFSLEDIHPPMVLPGHFVHTEEYPGSRRASLAPGLDMSMTDANANIAPGAQVSAIAEQAAATWQQGQTRGAASVSQPHFDTIRATSYDTYDLDMTPYNAAPQFHLFPHQQRQQSLHHPHHHYPAHHDFTGPPRQIATTGPFEPGRWRT